MGQAGSLEDGPGRVGNRGHRLTDSGTGPPYLSDRAACMLEWFRAGEH